MSTKSMIKFANDEMFYIILRIFNYVTVFNKETYFVLHSIWAYKILLFV